MRGFIWGLGWICDGSHELVLLIVRICTGIQILDGADTSGIPISDVSTVIIFGLQLVLSVLQPVLASHIYILLRIFVDFCF